MKTKIILPIILLLITSTAIFSQPLDTLRFSLEEARIFAEENSFIAKNAGLDVEIARKKVWETIVTGLPQVDGSAEYNINLKLPVSLIPADFIGGEKGEFVEVSFGQKYNSNFGFSVSQIIFEGSYIVGLGAAKIYLDLAKQTDEKTAIEIRESIAQSYYLVLIAEETRKIMLENLENSRKIYRETKAYWENGFREEQDIDQVTLLVKEAENNVIKAEREINVSKMVLKYALGVDAEQSIALTDSLPAFVNPIRIGKSSGETFHPDQHIDYRLMETQISLKKSRLNLEKVAFLPSVNANYSYTKNAYGDKSNIINESWFPSSLLGFSLSIPIFNSGLKYFRIKQAQMELEKTKNQQLQNIQLLQTNYITALTDLESVRDKFENDLENQHIAQRILTKTRIKFNNGMATSNELSQNESQFIAAYQKYISSTLQLLQAQLTLEKALGEL